MNKRSMIWALIGLLLITALACSAFERTKSPQEPGTSSSTSGPVDSSSTSGFEVKVVNRSPDEICYVLISPSEDEMWGDDWLGEEETIEPGDTRAFEVPAGTYDIKVETCGEATMATAWEVDDDLSLIVGDPKATVRLLVVNNSDTEICYVYISPSSAEEWGDDWMGSMESLPPGASRMFYVQPGVYDVQAADCDDNGLAEEYEVDLTDDTTWTIGD